MRKFWVMVILAITAIVPTAAKASEADRVMAATMTGANYRFNEIRRIWGWDRPGHRRGRTHRVCNLTPAPVSLSSDGECLGTLKSGWAADLPSGKVVADDHDAEPEGCTLMAIRLANDDVALICEGDEVHDSCEPSSREEER